MDGIRNGITDGFMEFTTPILSMRYVHGCNREIGVGLFQVRGVEYTHSSGSVYGTKL